MHQQNNCEFESTDQIAERQTNYLILRTLESKLDPNLFSALIQQVSRSIDLPQYTAWDGSKHSCGYSELKASQAQSDGYLLSSLVRNFLDKNFQILEESIVITLSQYLKNQLNEEQNGTHNVYNKLHRQLCKPNQMSRKNNPSFANFDRVKTVFGHCNFVTEEVSSIYNVYFDQKGTFLVSAGDEGILKIWDRETLTLQASLHGHEDYFTEIDISKCNKFIASAGKDAQIIIWELHTGKLLYKLTHHTKLINCVKFFCPKLSSSTPSDPSKPDQQYLFSCSDDGTVRLYDFTPISGWAKKQVQETIVSAKSSEEELRVRRSQRQRVSLSTSNATESVDLEALYTIELTPDDFRPGTRNKKLDTLVMNHQGLVVAGSSSCELLVWRLNYELIQKRVPKQDCFKFLGQFKMDRQSCVKFCEFNPKYGIPGSGEILMTGSGDGIVNLFNMSVSSWRSNKENFFNLEDNSRKILTIDDRKGGLKGREIKARATDGSETVEYITEEVQYEGMRDKSTFVKSVCDGVRWSFNGRFAIASVQCQKEGESVDFCRIKVWDVVEQTLTEDLSRFSGIRLPKNTFTLATHPIHEEILMTGSENGVLVLWNIHTKQLLKQFKQYGVYSLDANIMDNPLHGSWSSDGKVFASGNSCGTISLYSYSDVAHQYEATRVQQFFQFDLARQTDNPFEKITNKPTVCGYNMIPYEVQPENLMIRFVDINPDTNTVSFQRNLVIAKELGLMEERYYQDKLQTSLFDDEVINLANLPLIDSIQVSVIQQDLNNDVDMSELQVINQLQPQISNRENRRRRLVRQNLQRNNRRVTSSIEIVNSDESASSNSNVTDDQVMSSESAESDESSPDHELGRGRRLQNVVPRNQNQFEGQRNGGRPLRAARPANLRDTETIADEESYGRTAARGRNVRQRRISSSSESAESNPTQEVRNTRNGRQRLRRNESESSSEPQRKTRRRNRSEDFQENQVQELQRGTFYLSDHNLSSEPDDKVDFSSHMLIAATKCFNQKFEINYELGKTQVNETLQCFLCQRTDGEIVGPFLTKKQQSQQIYLHKDCIEINTYSYFHIQQKQWVNLETMLKYLVTDAQYQCYRCEGFGASVSCSTCGKNFHGYYCAGVYLIPLNEDNKQGDLTNTQFWQCLFCKSQQNFEVAITQTNISLDTQFSQLKKIDKSHLIANRQSTDFYVPQIDDVVLYFFQGHEDYIYQYNCHFYAGQKQSYQKKKTMPWFNPKTRQKIIQSPITLAKVVKIDTLFPSQRSLKLISAFGQNSSEYIQSPQMIQRIELQFIESSNTFYVDLFPNALQDFIILYQTFEHQQTKFRRESLIGKEVTIKIKEKIQNVKIIEESPIEPRLCPQSQWQTLLCTKIEPFDPQQRRQLQVDKTFRINFWDIIFDSQVIQVHGFNEHEHTKLKQYLQSYLIKTQEYLVYFKERVQEKIAPEYRQIIAQEMWFDLLMKRLENKYYRSARQFFFDLQLIATNAAAYNGKDHEVAVDAAEIVKRVKFEAMKLIDCNGDRQITERIQDAKNLTAQSKLSRQLVDIRQNYQNIIDESRTNMYEESKEEVPQRLGGKRSRGVVPKDSPKESQEAQIAEQEQRTLRKRQRII